MFKKFTDTISGTLDTVKNYGSSMGIGQSEGGAPIQGKGGLAVPGKTSNGTVSAPVTAVNTPDPNSQKRSLASNTFMGLQSTLGKITGRGNSSNPVIMASMQSHNNSRGPILGNAVETNESRITDYHTLSEEHRVNSYHDITSFEQYKKVSETGQMQHIENRDNGPPADSRMNGNPKLTRSYTDDIIDQEFAAAKVNLDDVLDMPDYVDEFTPVVPKNEGDEQKKPKKKQNKHLRRIIRCIQDNRVKGGCVDPEEMDDANEEHIVLKKVLNILFLVIGVLLFAAVFVVIIYTTYGMKEEPTSKTEASPVTLAPNATRPYYEYVVEDYDESESNWVY